MYARWTMDGSDGLGVKDMKPTVHELFERAANDVGLRIHRSGALMILMPKKARPSRSTRADKNGKKR